MHVASTALLTFYRVCAKRGSPLPNVAGIVVHDHWKPYYTMPGVLHALCNAHHLRELKALVEITKKDWARKMQRLLPRGCHLANRGRGRGVALKPRLVERLERCYDGILVEGLTFHEAQPPLATTTASVAVVHRIESDIIFSYASSPASKTPAGSARQIQCGGRMG
jgi:transposase